MRAETIKSILSELGSQLESYERSLNGVKQERDNARERAREADATIADLRRQLAEREGDGGAKHDGDWTFRNDPGEKSFWRIVNGRVLIIEYGKESRSSYSIEEALDLITRGEWVRRVTSPSEPATFSPGPWTYDARDTLVRRASNRPIAQIYGNEREQEILANGRLIAAAPELYAYIKLGLNGKRWDGDIRAVLDRIEGRQS